MHVQCTVRITRLLVDNQVRYAVYIAIHFLQFHTLTLTGQNISKQIASVIDMWQMQQNLLHMTVSKVIISVQCFPVVAFIQTILCG